MLKEFVYDKEKLPHPRLSGHPELIELYYKAWELAFQKVTRVEREGGKPCLACIPNLARMWVWDSCLMTFFTNYSNGTITAFNNLDVLYDMRREDGFIGMAYDYEIRKPAFGESINPPLFAWAEWQYYLVTGDKSRFREVLPAIEGLYSFIENNRKRFCGLYWFADPGATGMDNSPRGAFPTTHQDGGDICHVDLAAQQALSAFYLSKIFNLLENAEKSNFYKLEHTRIEELINQYHWHEKSGFYYDFFHPAHEYDFGNRVTLLNSKTLAAAWTVLSRTANEKQLEKLNAHFLNPEEFYTEIPFATLSKDNVNYIPTGGYWLGGVWASTNYALIKGWKERGLITEARAAAFKYVEAMCRVYAEYEPHTIWEAYAPEQLSPSIHRNGRVVRKDFVGWSGIGPITMLIENIIGLDLDAEKNTVTFHLGDCEESGIENLCFNGGYLSVLCKDYDPQKREGKICVKAEKAFTLRVINGEKEITVEASVGESVFTI